MTTPLHELRTQAYDLRQSAAQLRMQVGVETDEGALDQLVAKLAELESNLSVTEKELWAAEAKTQKKGLVVNTESQTDLLGADTTGLEVKVNLRMAYLPTGIYHLLDASSHPLLSCKVRNADNEVRRVRVITFVEGYSAQAVDTVELKANATHSFNQLPTLFPDSIRQLNEMTRATLNVLVEDLDGKIELHRTHPVWLLARNTVSLEMKDPNESKIVDMTRYLGAFVTPHEPSIMQFLSKAVEYHPAGRFAGYQDPVKPQVRAIFKALKSDAKITYINSVITFDPAEGSRSQRVRLPRESLGDGQANCIDGTLLFASLLEAISLDPAIVIVPGHALVAWKNAKNGKKWNYLETVEIGTNTFEKAMHHGGTRAAVYKKFLTDTQDVRQFRQWPVRDLRIEHGITPLE